jgi:hypothetical protein
MRFAILVALVLSTSALAVPSQVKINKVTEPITVDGDLSDSAWESARRVDAFVEYYRGDNTEPPARTVGFLAYDAAAVYVAFRAEDPRPEAIRAPLVDRDKVLGDQDYVAILLDTANDRRSGVAFRVNPRGVQTDSVVDDASGNEDFSPDFFYEAVARRVPGGWTAEMRIPLSSLRYPSSDPQTWGVILMRNYPRDFRYIMSNTPIPKNTNCFICHAATMTGLEGLPTGSHFTLVPYSTASSAFGGPEGSGQSFDSNLGLDLKWNPSTRLTLDGTINPDFSQIESDVPQLAVDTQFALSYPEKRAFFLEGTELLSTVIQAVYTRTITSPAWGARATGQVGSTAYTVLVADDRGGGVTILPGAYGSTSIAQEPAQVLIGRARRSIGSSYVGLLATAREGDARQNRVLGPDFEWKINPDTRLMGQFLMSDTNGDSGHVARLAFGRDSKKWDIRIGVREFTPRFAADSGFIPQVGVRTMYTEGAARFYPKRGLTYLRAFLGRFAAYEYDGSELAKEELHPGFYFQGKFGSEGWITYRVAERERVKGRLLDYSMVDFSLRAAPWRMLPALQLSGRFGEKIDYESVKVGTGANLSLSTTVRPTDHLELQATLSRDWLDGVYTAAVDWMKATYTFSARSLARVIAQRDVIDRDDARNRALNLSALYGYKLNVQTVFFVGYGDASSGENAGPMTRDRQSVFVKVAYAFQK